MSRNSLFKDHLLAEALPDGIAIINNAEQIIWWNHIAGKLLGLASSVDTIRLQEIVGGSVLSALMDDVHFIEKQSPIDDNVFLSMLMRPYQDNLRLLIIKDITEKHKLESMRQDFVANVSHELRTPLTVFRGYLEILLDQTGFTQEKLSEILTLMSGQSNRMSSLVRDLLLLSRLESALPDTTHFKPISIADMLKSICDDAIVLSGEQKHHIFLDADEHLLLAGKKEELQSAFSNLIYNAINYTPPGGKIWVRWYRDGDQLIMSVKDTGIGIAKKHLSRVTQRFYRVDKSRSHRGESGTGLGLAIVKHVLLRHQGKLLIESEIKKGSLFRCVFLEG